MPLDKRNLCRGPRRRPKTTGAAGKFRWGDAEKTPPRNPAHGAQPVRGSGVYLRMGYIIGLVALLVFVPLLFLLLSRRTVSGGGIDSRDKGVTHLEPSSDQPTPPPGPQTDRAHQGSDRGVPPG